MTAQKGVATFSVTSALHGSGFSTQCPSRFTSGNSSIPPTQQAGWTPGSVWTVAENLLSPPVFDLPTVEDVVISHTGLRYPRPQMSYCTC